MKTEKKVELLLKKNRFKGGGETKSVSELEELYVFKTKKTANEWNYQRHQFAVNPWTPSVH